MTPRRDVSMSPSEVTSFLEQPRNAVLSTLERDGIPHAAAMWYVPGDLEIRMWTYGKSQKAVNLRRDARCCLLVEDGLAYDELRGVLIQGTATIIESYDEVVAVGRALYERYTQPTLGLAYGSGPNVEIERQARKRIAISLPLGDPASWDHRKLGTE